MKLILQNHVFLKIQNYNFQQNLTIFIVSKKGDLMKKVKEILSIIYSLAVVALLLFMAYLLIKYVGILIIKGIEKISGITSNMDSVVIVALITGGISIVTVVISSIISKFIEYKQITKRYLYEKREKPYSEFISMIYKLQISQKNGKEEYTQTQMINDILNFSQALTLWGSSKVIKKWIKFREIIQENPSRTENLFMLEEIAFEIRKDMGQKRKGLKQGDLLSFFVNDIKSHLPKNNKQ